LSWENVKNILNNETGDNWGESKYRKWWYSFSEGMDYAKVTDITDTDILNELELKKIELEEERKKLQTIRVDYNRMIREKSRTDLMYELVRDSIEALPVPKFDIELTDNSNGKK